MEVTIGNLQSVFTGLDARFKRAASNVAVPGTGRIVARLPGKSRTDEYPMSGLLGDLAPMVDELYMSNIWMMVQHCKAIDWGHGLWIYRNDIEDDQISIYNGPVEELAIMGKTHPYRNVAATLMAGFTTLWADGVNAYSDWHSWPGNQAWDNLDHLSLTAPHFDTACLHLEQRLGPNGQSMGLSPKLLVVGPAYRAMAETILNMQLIGGGNSNRQYKRCDLMVCRASRTSTGS